ncbi:type II toxin-antitoxin system PemK/MazF family toxin [Cyanobium sp. WAJ14-Wanaka]|uniref:type II toxin-antitoxin system PemK/MazF family toxin n=1 Tax=Cyanobium sp. WAJ14-Wanaka TaxID=2823725 RepID=UPI0020CEFE92|nr:type II toxin-antitoxin system PemK/MazF family toxin [Cyanobium sp. WAJ14-Wanaka]
MAGGPGYAGKPRPVLVVQDDAFDQTDSVLICPLTTHAIEAPILRVDVSPSPANGLRSPSCLMVDKLTTVPRSRLGKCIGQLSDDQLLRLNRSLMVVLGLAR